MSDPNRETRRDTLERKHAESSRDVKGELSTLEFPQEWARTGAESVRFTRDLPIGPNVDLEIVRTRRLRCTCAEQPERAATP